jgi:hypothetical protein
MSKGKEKRNYCLYTLLATVLKSVSNFFYNVRYLFKHRLDRKDKIKFTPSGQEIVGVLKDSKGFYFSFIGLLLLVNTINITSLSECIIS